MIRDMTAKPHKKPPVPASLDFARHTKFVALALGAIAAALGVGVVGYHFLGGLPWVDALLESSMILGGMGAIAPMTNDAVKLFASAYALFSGFVALSSIAVILAPFLHRLLHHLHVDGEEKEE